MWSMLCYMYFMLELAWIINQHQAMNFLPPPQYINLEYVLDIKHKI